jgi:colicin import membrane protein
MSAIVYREPYQLPAGILAVAVHGVFFALLYFGFAWQTQPAGAMSVELWQSLPDMVAAPPVQAKVEKAVQAPQPEKTVKPDIALPDKKKPVLSIVEGVEAKPAAASKENQAKPMVQKPGTSGADRQAAREQAEQAAAIGRVIDEYTGKIIGKVRRNIVMPPDVANDARAEFSVTLLPGGAVLSTRLTRSSGNAVYDNAVERAILKSQPLPLPADVTMFNRFRELKLVFRPVE